MPGMPKNDPTDVSWNMRSCHWIVQYRPPRRTSNYLSPSWASHERWCVFGRKLEAMRLLGKDFCQRYSPRFGTIKTRRKSTQQMIFFTCLRDSGIANPPKKMESLFFIFHVIQVGFYRFSIQCTCWCMSKSDPPLRNLVSLIQLSSEVLFGLDLCLKGHGLGESHGLVPSLLLRGTWAQSRTYQSHQPCNPHHHRAQRREEHCRRESICQAAKRRGYQKDGTSPPGLCGSLCLWKGCCTTKVTRDVGWWSLHSQFDTLRSLDAVFFAPLTWRVVLRSKFWSSEG